MDNYIGRLLDNRYEILEVIGSGGMAVVYKARDHRLKRLIAVKILKDEYSQDDEFRRRFTAESQAVAMLSHPNIVSVYDVNSCDGINYIVMELIDGITLKQYMARRGKLNWRETLHFSLQIDKALEHAHGRGIIHRDIKPHNIMILKDGSVKVADFGIARMTSAQNTLTREALGSVHYISPEQAKGGKVDCRTDLYSLGVVMYEMMTAKTPFDGDTPVAVAIQHINGKAQAPSELNTEIPAGLEQITMHAMTADLEDRYASATDMLNDLEEFRKDPSIVFAFAPVAAAAAAAPAPAAAAAPAAPILVTPAGRNGNAAHTEETPARRGKAAAAPVLNEKEALENEKKEDKRTILIVAIISLIAVLGVAYLLFGVLLKGLLNKDEPLYVPNLVGAFWEEIYPSDYPEFEFDTNVEWVYDEEVPYGHVISQLPLANTEAEEGTMIHLVLSRGEETSIPLMPPLNGFETAKAQQILVDLQLSLQIVMDHAYSDTYPEGTVAYTDPVEGVALQKGQTVTVYVSVGPEIVEEEPETEMVEVPDVVGKSLEDAVDALREAGLEVGDVTTVESDEPAGTVLKQAVMKDTEVEAGTKIDLEVAVEPEEEPEEEPEPEPEPEPEKPNTGTGNESGTGDNTQQPEQPQEPEEPEEPETPTIGGAVVNVALPSQAGEVAVDLWIGDTLVASEDGLTADGSSVPIYISGSGTQVVDIWIDGVYTGSVTVTFS